MARKCVSESSHYPSAVSLLINTGLKAGDSPMEIRLSRFNGLARVPSSSTDPVGRMRKPLKRLSLRLCRVHTGLKAGVNESPPVIRSEVEGSRDDTLKLTQRGSLDFRSE